MRPVPVTPRLFTIACRLPAHVSDQEAADSFYRVLRTACRPRKDERTYPDGASLEVHAATLTFEQDGEIRRDVFGEPSR
jgi:hypothetical protein